MQYSLQQSKKLLSNLQTVSNEKQLDMYVHLECLESQKIWQSKAYYLEDKELEKFAMGTFASLLKEAFGITNMWYQSMKMILNLPDAAKLYAKYGRSNMVTYLNSTEAERKAILVAAEESKVIPRFGNIKRKLFPQAQEAAPTNLWKEKYETLQKEFETYKIRAQQNIESLKAAIKILSEGMNISKEAMPKAKEANA